MRRPPDGGLRLKKIVSECDAHAFVTVCDVHEALGEGFSYRHIS